MAHLGMEQVTYADAQDMIAEVDIDGDGELSFSEFKEVLQAAGRKEHFHSGRPMREFSYKSFAYRKFKNVASVLTAASGRGGVGDPNIYSPAPGSDMPHRCRVATPSINGVSPRCASPSNGRTAGAIGSLESALLAVHLDVKSMQADLGRLHSRADMDVKRLEQKMALMYEVLDQRIASACGEIDGKVDALLAGMEGL